MSRIAYFRVSTRDQSVEAQRNALGGGFDREFTDEGISGSTLAMDRPGFAALSTYIRDGDVLAIYSVDRLGRDALDVQSTVRALLKKGVTIEVRGLGVIGRGVGELIVAVLAQVADMEKQRIVERTQSGRTAARAALLETGLTHKGKRSLGRRPSGDAVEVAAWRRASGASITQTAANFGLSAATVKRYCASQPVLD